MSAKRFACAGSALGGKPVAVGESDGDLTPKGKATRDAILAAATELFAARGVAGTSITDIASKAAVNRAQIAYYFGSKSGLYDAIIDAAVEDASALLSEVSVDGSEGDPIRRWVLAFAEMLSRRPNFGRMIIHEYFQPGRLFEPETANKLSGFMRLTEQMLKRAPLGAEARRYDPQIVHLIVVGAINYFILTAPFRERLTGRLDRPLTTPGVDEFAETLATIVSRGLTR